MMMMIITMIVWIARRVHTKQQSEHLCFAFVCLGGPSTKLCFQSLNRADVNSVSHLIPLALYEGIGEDYDMLSHIFKPMFDQLHTFTQSFNLQPPDPAKTQHSLYLQENEI